MYYSKLFIPTLKENPADAEVMSHKLMVRAGLIRQVASGIYSILPLGLRVLRKVEQIIREEMNGIGGQEVFLPSVQPAELWQESGRWELYGKELLRFRDRHDREFCYGPTHEEVITDIVRKEIKSYRQLPLILYQIQTKFRDEVRPRFGVMRGREFTMKDAYSFHADEKSTQTTYFDMARAYSNVFKRCGLDFKMVEADSGTIGGKFSHEFAVLADSGEDSIAYCDTCEYASNLELAQAKTIPDTTAPLSSETLREVETPGKTTVNDVADFLSVTADKIVKTILFESDLGLVAGLVRGDREINAIKLKNFMGADWLHPATEQTFAQHPQIPCGYVGPVGLNCKVYADWEVAAMHPFVSGANKIDKHFTGVTLGRDFKIEKTGDIRSVKAGEPCPRCEGGKLLIKRGIEVGHIFILGTKYSEAMNAVFLDDKGKENAMVMGCYGIGVGRTAAAAIEQNHDDNGIVWPLPIAPFAVHIIPTNFSADAVREAAEKTYKALTSNNIEVILDDRPDRLGVKLKDADLLGMPLQIIIGPKNLEAGKVEVKSRKTNISELHPFPEILDQIPSLLQKLAL